jgi:hypothetical protein
MTFGFHSWNALAKPANSDSLIAASLDPHRATVHTFEPFKTDSIHAPQRGVLI